MVVKRGDARKVGEININFVLGAGRIKLGSNDVYMDDVASALELLARNMRAVSAYYRKRGLPNVRLSYVDLDEGKFSAGNYVVL